MQTRNERGQDHIVTDCDPRRFGANRTFPPVSKWVIKGGCAFADCVQAVDDWGGMRWARLSAGSHWPFEHCAC